MSLFEKLAQLIPILAGMNLGKDSGMILDLIKIAEDEIVRRMRAQGRSREEILADASATWDEAIKGADDLAKLGHE